MPKTKIQTILFFLLASQILFAQALRKNSISIASGYVAGSNPKTNSKSDEYLLWGSFLTSYLHEISGVAKQFKQEDKYQSYKENFWSVKGTTNLFPFYFSIGYSHSEGKYKSPYDSINSAAQIFSFSATYYKNLIFYSLEGSFEKISWKGNTKIFFGKGGILWRPNLFFSASFFPALTQIGKVSYFSFENKLRLQPTEQINFIFNWFIGKRKYYFDYDYLIFYNVPYLEKGAFQMFLTLSLAKNLALIFNYEEHSFEDAVRKFASATLSYKFEF